MENFIKNINNCYSINKKDNGFILCTPIMYSGADHTFSFYIEPNANGSYKITDCGQTIDYLRENLNINNYMTKIKNVCEHFEIELKDNTFIDNLASIKSNQTMRNLEKFIGAMNIIANINLF